jgi:hypothetical protein
MESSGSATALVNLALENGDAYSAAAVYMLADGECKEKLEFNMFDKRRNALLLARWEHTPASVLEALSSKSDGAITVRLDKNPNTSTLTLTKLYVDKSEAQKNLTVLIAQHKHTSLGILKRIAQFEHDVASLLAVSKNVTADADVFIVLLRRFAVHPLLEALQKNIAENPSAPAELLESIYDKGDEYVRAAVIGHGNCSLYLLNKALQERSVLIQRQVAADKRLSQDDMVRLSLSQDRLVRCALALNSSAPKQVVKRFVNDENELVRRAIASRHDLTTSSAMHLMEDHDVWVRQKLARNPIVPAWVMSQLAKDSHADVRRGVARNSRCPVALLKLLAVDEDYWVRSAVAYQHRSPKEVLKVLVEDTEVDVLSGVANNPKTPQNVLKKLATSIEPDIRRGVILNQSATRLTLLPLLEDAYYLHRLMLVTNPKLKDQDKRHLCLDPDLQVRFTAFRYFANQFAKNSN